MLDACVSLRHGRHAPQLRPIHRTYLGAWACRHGIDVASLLRTIHGVRTRETVLRQNIPGIDVDAEVAAIMQAEMKGPGSMTETLMPKAATSWARESANPSIAALEAL